MLQATPDPELEAVGRCMHAHAQAPYSRFSEGAALRSAPGRVFGVCNVAKTSLPLRLCAEACAHAAMIAAGERTLAAVLLVADAQAQIPPCGGCRQRFAELAGPEGPVTVITLQGAALTVALGTPLPQAFGREQSAGLCRGALP